MRFTSLVLVPAALLFLGCGAESGNHDASVKLAPALSPPSIVELSPGSAPVGSVAFTMTVNGDHFGTDSIVFWNGIPHNATVVTSKQLMVNLTDTDLTHFGLVQVYVRTGGLNSNTVDFDVTAQ
jgi:IPT/TIG domain-containing protein